MVRLRGSFASKSALPLEKQSTDDDSGEGETLNSQAHVARFVTSNATVVT